MSKTLLLKPRMSEKAYALSEQENTYVFDVPTRVSRLEVMRAVALQFNVEAKSARVARTASKTQRRYKRSSRTWHKGETSGIRKVYITLKEGNKLPLFAAEEETKKAKTKEKK